MEGSAGEQLGAVLRRLGELDTAVEALKRGDDQLNNLITACSRELGRHGEDLKMLQASLDEFRRRLTDAEGDATRALSGFTTQGLQLGAQERRWDVLERLVGVLETRGAQTEQLVLKVSELVELQRAAGGANG